MAVREQNLIINQLGILKTVMATGNRQVHADDVVEYFLFPRILNDEDGKEKLTSLRADYFKVINELSQNYIWHEDSINLAIVDHENVKGNIPTHLYGLTHFGLAAEDEWFVVYLLRELTSIFTDLVVRIIDSDGEFLLVEAADYLPRWANPETCINRVFLHCGKIHLISIADRPSSLTPLPSGTPAIMDAVHIVRSMPHLTLAPSNIQEPIQQRIDRCASQIASSLHRTNIYVPVAVAALLKSYPALIAPAVHAFCQRDASQLEVVRAMRYFPPETRVWTSVTFTKCLYAMLVQRSFQPDKRTGWTLPPISDSKRLGSEIGMKLAVGFELLANEESTRTDTIESDPRWSRFISSLQTKGYFQDFLEGSAPHNDLLEKAREFYTGSLQKEQSAKQPVVLRLMETVTIDMEQFKKEESHLPPPDDDTWLSIDPASLESILENKFGNLHVGEQETEILPHLQNFLERTSDFEGIVPSQGRKKSRKLSHLAPPSRKISTLSNGSDVSQMSNKIGFDPDSFTSAMQGILDFALPEDNWDLESESESSGLSSYSEEEEMEADMNSKDVEKYVQSMDQELKTTNVRQTLVDQNLRKESFASEGGESFSDVENFQPVTIDSTALESLLASYTSQHGGPGPASTLLRHLDFTSNPLPTKQDTNE